MNKCTRAPLFISHVHVRALCDHLLIIPKWPVTITKGQRVGDSVDECLDGSIHKPVTFHIIIKKELLKSINRNYIHICLR